MDLRVFLAGMLLVSGVMAAPVGAQAPASDDVLLRVTQQELDEDAAGRQPKSHAEALANQFKVPVKTVEALRADKQGWGEIVIRLGLAQELTKSDPKTFPGMTEALQRVGELRSQGMGWGAIAKELGFKLGPVVSEVQRVRQEMKAQAKLGATADVVNPQRGGEDRGGKREGIDKAQRPERAERAQRPERPERPQRPERPDRPEKPGK